MQASPLAAQDAQNLAASHGPDHRDAMLVTQHHANLRRRHALPGQLGNLRRGWVPASATFGMERLRPTCS
eukprot:357397-Chlamydomonas_euryale.AAC.3